jgi:phosphoribosylglycinamide formyltransferase-1
MSVLRLGILGSGKGSNFVAIQRAIAAGLLPATIEVVISDLPAAGILTHARQFGLPALALPASRYKTRLEPELESHLVELLRSHQVEWVILAGYMRVVKAPLLEAYPNRILNIHPSLLPQFKGLEAWKQALEARVPETGCTVHLVNAAVDGGKILGQARVPLLPEDTAESLHARIQLEEHRLFPEVLRQIAAGELVI